MLQKEALGTGEKTIVWKKLGSYSYNVAVEICEGSVAVP